MASEANARVLCGFLDYLRIEKGLAANSIVAYTTDILQFAEFLEKQKRLLLTARRNDVREFLQQLFSHQVDGRSVGRKLSALRHLYRYLLLDKRIDHDPTLDIESPRQWKVLPKSLARDEIESTLASPAARLGHRDTKDAAALAARDRAMLELLYAGALRVSEMVNATLEDLKLESGYMLVRGKGDKERIVPLGKPAQDALSAYLAQGRPVLAGMRIAKAGEECGASVRDFDEEFTAVVYRKRWAQVDAAAGVADGGRIVGCFRSARVAPHVAALVRYAHGGKRCGPAHGADNSRARGYFDYAGVYASRAGSAADGLSETSSEGEGAVKRLQIVDFRLLIGIRAPASAI